MQRRRRNVKIIATLGPASATPEGIRQLHEAGADVFRINMSHADHDRLAATHAMIRAVEAEGSRPIGILVDLQGPKLRIATFADGPIVLKTGDPFRLDLDLTPGIQSRVGMPHPEIFRAVQPGSNLLLDDGKVRLRVHHVGDDFCETTVEVGGRLSDRKGVNVPDALLNLSALSDKDRRDLDRALDLGVDWVALSFVQRAEDVAETRKIVAGRAFVMSKIEKPQALTNLDRILDLSDGLMVARGDLGVELPIERVPGLQKQIVHAARIAGKPVVVATQMLESMITAPVPTRAEVSDVSNAVFEGADAVMLSAESAAGQYPLEAVSTMNKIAETVENDPNYRTIIQSYHAEPDQTTADAITAAAREVAETLNVGAIVCYTSSGSTALRAARERPKAPILALTPAADTARRLALAWGIHCVPIEDASDIDDMLRKACAVSQHEGFANPGDRLVITAGLPFGTPGATNLMRIAHVDGPLPAARPPERPVDRAPHMA